METPLHYAASFGHMEVCRLIYEKEVYTHGYGKLPDLFGKTPYGNAVLGKHLELMTYFKEKIDDEENPFDVAITPILDDIVED